MTGQYYPPKFLADKFNCLRCGVYAQQFWGNLHARSRFHQRGDGIPPVQVLQTKNNLNADLPDTYAASKCEHCNAFTLWFGKDIIYPTKSAVESPNTDLPSEVKNLYMEAAQTFNSSPRASAALLRLALQLLLKEIGGKGGNINEDIAIVVKNGVSSQVQKALDVVRVFGNNGVHPGTIDINENSDLVLSMFSLINFIADKLITQQKELNSLYNGLPDTVKEQIQKRDE